MKTKSDPDKLPFWHLWSAEPDELPAVDPNRPASVERSPAVVAFRLFLALTLLTGVIYPIALTMTAQTLFPRRANGSVILLDGRIVGSELLAQRFTNAAYFWPRPSAAEFATVPSGASNKGPTAADLKSNVTVRAAAFRVANELPPNAPVPPEMLLASASGLDPHISPEAARLQIARVAAAHQFSAERRQRLAILVEQAVEPPQFGVFGEPRVNVLKLNLALDKLQ